MCKRIIKYLLWYAHEHSKFRLAEINSIASMFDIKLSWIEEPSEQPFCLFSLSSESDARKIMSRCVLGKSLYELWCDSDKISDVHKRLKNCPKTFLAQYSNSDQSFRIRIESFGKKLRKDEKLEKIEEFHYLPFEGPIELTKPDHSFHLIEYYGLDPNNVPEKPTRIFFGRWICDGQRSMINKFNLKQRKFIGNTSMDPTLSLIMANMAKIKKNDFVLDPFVGSGSVFVPAAYFGAYVMGTDIDYLMIHGKAKPTRYKQKKREPDECIKSNLKQYNLQDRYLDVLVADASLPLWRNQSLIDAVITDPPYGIREASERIGTKKNYVIPTHLIDGHIPSKITYSLQNIIKDLLNLCAFCLTLGGRLVYWLPVFKEDFKEDCIPSHPCLALISFCEQVLTSHSSRYLITMEKIFEPQLMDNTDATVPETTSQFRHKFFQALKNAKDSDHNG
ncbi:tRNA (guanine(10)-N2)-methyltransferase homolog [Centruroides vittatus]|uniref:tRNA (guanine(10)-N2)-methyltransferase homolog n=1 Tax=Centruroides vittatus TaxID=120091 RepID=UPI00350ECC76